MTGWLSVRIMWLSGISRSSCQRPGVPVRQHYKVTIGAHCHKSVPVLKWRYILLGCKTTKNTVLKSELLEGKVPLIAWSIGAVLRITCWLCVGLFYPGNIFGHFQLASLLVAVRTHGECIVFPHWNTKLAALWPDISLSHVIWTLT